jgi:hypothetical protein
MSPTDLDKKTLAESLLMKVHEQSEEGPERSPFWREGRWRCEYYRTGGSARLKVFSGESCVHEEVVQGSSADRRSLELKKVFLESRRAGREDTLLR